MSKITHVYVSLNQTKPNQRKSFLYFLRFDFLDAKNKQKNKKKTTKIITIIETIKCIRLFENHKWVSAHFSYPCLLLLYFVGLLNWQAKQNKNNIHGSQKTQFLILIAAKELIFSIMKRRISFIFTLHKINMNTNIWSQFLKIIIIKITQNKNWNAILNCNNNKINMKVLPIKRNNFAFSFFFISI